MDLVRMPDKQRLELRKRCLSSLYNFCIATMGYDDIIDPLHGQYCGFLSEEGKRKQATMPRSFVKTWIGSIAYPVWVTLVRKDEDEFPYPKAWEDKFWTLGPDMRILIASYVISNAEKMIQLVRKTYESNAAMQMLFPEVIPHNFNKTRWSNQSACINRENNFTESTFEAAGVGGSSISRHYDLIVEDDLVYAKKDDLTGRELHPSYDDIEKAIGWHKLSHSLLVPGKHTHIHNLGTRWARHDLVDYIWTNEPSYKRFIRGAVDLDQLNSGIPWEECRPEWEACYDIQALKAIRDAQGPYMFATQYLLKPMSPEEMLFRPSWLQMYTKKDEVPKSIRIYTTVDLAEWGTSRRKRGDCNSVVLTCAWDHLNHCWILHYDVGRFDPSRVIEVMGKHWTAFKPEYIGVEAVYYQKALAHFATKAMEEKKVPWMSIRNIKPEGNESKELRIRAIEPIASNFALHCKPTHTEFITEFSEYVPNSDACKKDILDALAYQIQIARPGVAMVIPSNRDRNDFLPLGTMDEFLEKCWTGNNPKDRFGNPWPPQDPFNQEEKELDAILNAADPYYDLAS